MFYDKKQLFFVILYVMSIGLYYLINKQLILTGFMSGPVLGSFLIFVFITAVCFLASVAIGIVVKYVYAGWCGICKAQPKQMLAHTSWTIFTVLCYAAVFIIFLKMIEY